MTVTVAIPVRDGGELLRSTLESVRAQRLGQEVELLVCDSGSQDGSVALARSYGAEVIQIAPEEFSHGATRNLLMERSRGEYVALLTQDAVPAGEGWLERLVSGFALAEDVGLTFGPYRPRPHASPMVVRELTDWFASFGGDQPRIDRLSAGERDLAARALLGPRGFFTDANGCIAKAAWASVPFRPVAYAEDHLLAHDMLRAGFAKVYLPEAAVIHSHEYSGWGWLRRSFDEVRALDEVYGLTEPGELGRAALTTWGQIGADWRWLRSSERREPAPFSLFAAAIGHRLMRAAGTILGTRAERLPDPVVRRLSLEGRGR